MGVNPANSILFLLMHPRGVSVPVRVTPLKGLGNLPVPFIRLRKSFSAFIRLLDDLSEVVPRSRNTSGARRYGDSGHDSITYTSLQQPPFCTYNM